MSRPTPDDERAWEELSAAAKKSTPAVDVVASRGPTPDDEKEWLELSTGLKPASPVVSDAERLRRVTEERDALHWRVVRGALLVRDGRLVDALRILEES